MADVRLAIGGRHYIVTCADGEDARLQALGQLVDEKAQEAGGAGLTESRALLFSALLLADKLYDGASPATISAESNARKDDAAIEQVASALEKLAERIEQLADRLEQ